MQDADPPRPHEPVERIQKGSFAWRGGEGSQTDRLARSVHYHESTPQERVAEAFTRPSSGLVYMQARYYDPQIGRFTQLDPVRYGPETFATGQNNRWTYCANDPVNASDPSGNIPAVWGIAFGVGLALGITFGVMMGLSYQGAMDPLSIAVAVVTSVAALFTGMSMFDALFLGPGRPSCAIHSWNTLLRGLGITGSSNIVLPLFAAGFLLGAIAGVYGGWLAGGAKNRGWW